MSWFSEFLHSPIDFIKDEPLKALGLLAAPLGLAAAPFLAPEIGAAGAGLFGAGEAAGGLAGEGALAGGAGLEGLLGGAAGGTTAGEGALGGLGFAGEAAGGEGGSMASLLSGEGAPFAGFGPGEGFAAPGLDAAAGGPEGLDAMAFAPSDLLPGGGDPYSEGIIGAGSAGGEAAPMGGATPESLGAMASGGPGGEQPGFWANMVNKAYANPWQALGVGAAGTGLAMNMMNSLGTSPNIKAMQNAAGMQSAQAQQFMSYLQKGTLPPGLESLAKTMGQSMKANIISNAAKNGMPTDPSQNSALAQDLQAADQKVFQWIAQQGMALLNSGIQLSGLSNTLYAQLEQLDRQKSHETGLAIANFASALNGRPMGYIPGMSNSIK